MTDTSYSKYEGNGVLLTGDNCEVFYFHIMFIFCLYFKICKMLGFLLLSKSFKDFRKVFIRDFVPSQKKDSLALSNASGFFFSDLY